MKIYYVKLEIISIVSIISIISIISSNSKNRPTFNLIYIYIYKYFKNCIRLFKSAQLKYYWHWECPRSERAERSTTFGLVFYIYTVLSYIYNGKL